MISSVGQHISSLYPLNGHKNKFEPLLLSLLDYIGNNANSCNDRFYNIIRSWSTGFMQLLFILLMLQLIPKFHSRLYGTALLVILIKSTNELANAVLLTE